MANENTNIKRWYKENFPRDTMGNDLVDDLTFRELFEAMDNYEDVYKTLFGEDGYGDIVIRERVFEELAQVMQCSYEDVYNQWLRCRG